MNGLGLLDNELRLLSRSGFARLVVVLTAALVVLGTRAVEYADDMQFHGMGRTSLTMSLGAAQYGAMAGAALFAMLTLLTLSRDRRQQSRAIVEAAAGYGRVTAARVVALLVLGLVTALVCLAAALVAHHYQTPASCEVLPYLFSLGLILLPALWFATLLAAALDLVFESLDVGFLTFGAMYFFGFTTPNYLLRWVQTSASVYSDFGGIEPVGRLVVYNRLFWSCLVTGAVLVGFWCRRRPGFMLGASLARNWGRGLVPATALAAVGLGVWVYAHEPHLFPADSVFQKDLPRTQQAWLETAECHTQLRPEDKMIAVDARYSFGKEQPAAQVEFITNAGLRIDTLTINGIDAAWSCVPQTDRVKIDLPAGPRADVEFRYQGRILYPAPGGFPGYITGRSVYLLENSHWLFEPLTEAHGPIRVAGSVTAPAHLTVVTPGRVESMTQEGQMRTWRFAAACPDLTLGLFAADYVSETFKVGPSTVEFYFSPRHETYIRAAGIADHIRDILQFYQGLLGSGPWKDMPLKIVETSVYKPGGHASLNVVTLAEYLLNRSTVSDPQTDPRLVLRDLKILAHELAHQWWGGGVAVTESGSWSSEGFAEYLAYEYLAAKYPPTVTDNIPRGWQSGAAQQRNAWYRRDADALNRMRPALRAKLLAGQAKGEAYSVLPLQLLAAEKRVGQETFRLRLAEIFREHQGGTLDRRDFMAAFGPDAIDWEKEQP
jgi:hypothetical protein